jgi:iron complex outermembrane recepter protein
MCREEEFMRLSGSIAVLYLSFAGAAFAGTVDVTVKDTDGLIVPGAEVVVVELKRTAVTGPEGTAAFPDLPAGHYHLAVRLSGFAGSRTEVDVSADGASAVQVALAPQVHFSETVTVAPDARDTFEAYQPTTVLSGEELQQRLGANLGDTLGSQVGVNTRSFGPGPARPVIRGLDGDRVLVLENGARTGDLSSQSGDHGVPLDPAAASQIEVVRGPATLLYGSNALGGVVNVVSDAIPSRPVQGVDGALTLQGGTANEEGGLSGHLGWGDSRWAVRAEASGRRTGDVKTPEGDIPNSESDLVSGGLGISRTGVNGYVGASYFYDDTTYGIPFIESGEVTLNPRRHRFDLRAEKRNLSSWISGIKLQLGHRNYRHDELDGGEIGTQFHNKFTEAQLLVNHRPVGKIKGTFGVWGTTREFSAVGEEALAPATDQKAFAGFFYEELPLRHVSLQLGGRVDATSFSPEGLPSRDFTEVSGSAGLLGYLQDDLTLAVNVARAARNPSLEELYNNGPHPGNFAFEIGNPDLGSEVGLGFDVSLRWRKARFVGELTAFRNTIDAFVFPLFTGEVEDNLPVITYVAADSTLQGFEAHVDLGLTPDLWLELGGDAVRGELRDTNEALPRMPPLRGWIGLRYQRNGFHLEGELRAAARQDRVYGAETPTDSYVVGNAHGSYTFAAGKTAHTVTLRLDNAGDTLYRSHLSFIKDIAPEMGRSVKLVYGVKF